jgi:hypothetical protein
MCEPFQVRPEYDVFDVGLLPIPIKLPSVIRTM